LELTHESLAAALGVRPRWDQGSSRVAGFDILYACQDVDFDRGHGLHSVPARLGVPRALRLAAVCHLGMILLLMSLPLVYPFGWVYQCGIAAVAVVVVMLVAQDQPFTGQLGLDPDLLEQVLPPA
jgi:4-hydroxybenzoate polyprenyltransferase